MAPAADVLFTFTDPTGRAVTNAIFKTTSLSTPRTNSSAIVITDQRSYRTDSDGEVTATNMIVGDYKCELLGPWAHSVFTISVPDTTNTLNAADIIASGTADLGALVGYTQSAADARFVGKTNSSSSGQVLTNSALFGLRVGITNTAAVISLLPSHLATVAVDTSGGNLTFTLPATSFVSDGRTYRVKNVGGNTLTVQAAGSDKIDGAASITLTNYVAVDLVKQSTNWWRF